ncbi:MAG: hypothetical protein HY761_06720 [Candidatus Omnitrophica bacterium]|nr:hypothetical protein [Candidatus Omnitrophota bacterium]
MKSNFFSNLKRFKIPYLILAGVFLFSSLSPAWAREGNYGNTTSLESFAGGALAGAVTDAGILLGAYALGPWGAAAAAAGSAASDVTGYALYYYNYNQYAKPMFEVAGVTVTKGQFYSMVAGMVVSVGVAYGAGVAQSAKEMAKETAKSAAKKAIEELPKGASLAMMESAAREAIEQLPQEVLKTLGKEGVDQIVEEVISSVCEAAIKNAVVTAVASVAKAGGKPTAEALEKAASEAVKILPKEITAQVTEESLALIKENIIKGVLGNLSTFDVVMGKIEALLQKFSPSYGMRSPYFQYGIELSVKKPLVHLASDMIVGTFKLWTQQGIKDKLEEAGWDELLADLVSQFGASVSGIFVNQFVSNLAFSALDAVSDQATSNDKVKVTRQTKDGKVETVEISIQELSQGKTTKGTSLQEGINTGEIGELQKALVLKIGEDTYTLDIDMNKGSVYRSLMQYVGGYSLSAVGGALDQADAIMLNAVNQAQQAAVSIRDISGKEYSFTAAQLNGATASIDNAGSIALSDVAQNKALAGILQSAEKVILIIPTGEKENVLLQVSGRELAQAQLSTLNLLTQAHVNTAALLNATGGLMTDVQGNTMSDFGILNQSFKAVQNMGLAPFVNLGVKLAVLSAMGYKTHYGDDDDKIFDNLVKRVGAGAIAGFSSGVFSNIDVLNTWYSGTTWTDDKTGNKVQDNYWRTRGSLSLSKYIAKSLIDNAVDAGLQIAWGQYCRVNEIRQPQALQELLHLASGVVAGSVVDALVLRAPAKDITRAHAPDGQYIDFSSETLDEVKEKQGAKKTDIQVYVRDGNISQVIATGNIMVVDFVANKPEENKDEKKSDQQPIIVAGSEKLKTMDEFQNDFGRELAVSLQQKSSETSASNNAPMRVGLSSGSGEIQYYHIVGYSQDSNSVELESEGTTKKKISVSLEDLSANVVQYGSGQALKGVSTVTGVLLGASTPGGQRTFMTPEKFSQQAKPAGVILHSLGDGQNKEVSSEQWAAIAQSGPRRSVEYYRFAGDGRTYIRATDQEGNASPEHTFISTDGNILEMSGEEFNKSVQKTEIVDVYNILGEGEFIFAGPSQRSPLKMITLPGYEINGTKFWTENTADPLISLKSATGDVHYASVSQIRAQGGTARSESTGEFELDADTTTVYSVAQDTRKIMDVVNEKGVVVGKKETGIIVLSSKERKEVELAPEDFRVRTREITRTVYGLNIAGFDYSGETRRMPSLGEDPISKGRINFSMRDVLGRFIPATLENIGDNLFLSTVNATLFPVNLRTPINGMNGLQARFNEQDRFIEYMKMRAKGYSPLQANRALMLESLSQQANSRLASSVSAVFTNPILPRSSRTYASFKPTSELVKEETQRRKALREQAERFIDTAKRYKPDTAEQIVGLEVKKTEIAEQVNKKEKKKKELEADPIYAAYQDLQKAKEQGLNPDVNTISLVVATNAQFGVFAGEEEQVENINKLAGQSMNRDALGAEEISVFEGKVKDFVSIQETRINGLRDEMDAIKAPLPEINRQLQDLSIPRQEIFQWVVAAQGLTPVYSAKLPDSAPVTTAEITQGWALRDKSVYFFSKKGGEGEDNWMQQALPVARQMAEARQMEYSVYDSSLGHGQIGGIYHYQRRDEAAGMDASLNTNEALFMRHFSASSSTMLKPQERGILGKYLSLPNIGDGVVNSTYSLSVAGGLPLDQLTYGRSVIAQPVMQALTQDMLKAQKSDLVTQDQFMQEQFDKFVKRMQLPDAQDEKAVQEFNAEKEKLLALSLEDKKEIIRKFSSARPVFFSPVTSLLSRTRVDLWGRARSTEYFGQDFVSEDGQDFANGNWNLVQLPKTTEYYYGPFGSALTRTTDYTAITPPEYVQEQSVVGKQDQAAAPQGQSPVPVEARVVIRFPKLPTATEQLFSRDDPVQRAAKAVATKRLIAAVENKDVEVVKVSYRDAEKLFADNPDLVKELDGIVRRWYKKQGRVGRGFKSDKPTSHNTMLLWYIANNHDAWNEMSAKDKERFTVKFVGWATVLEDWNMQSNSDYPSNNMKRDAATTAVIQDYDPDKAPRHHVANMLAASVIWLPRSLEVMMRDPEPKKPEVVPTVEIQPSGYAPVSVGANTDYNYNFYSIGQGHSPYGNPSYSWRLSETRSGPALQPYMYLNTGREAAFLRDKGKRMFEEALNAAYAGGNKPQFDSAIPSSLTDQIWQIAQSVVFDFKQFEAIQGDDAQEQKDLPLTKRVVFDRFNAERAKADKHTSGELFERTEYVKQIGQLSAPANVVWQSGVYKYTRFNTEENAPLLQWGVTSGYRAENNLQLAPAFTLPRNGAYNRDSIEANIRTAYNIYTQDINYLRDKKSSVEELVLQEENINKGLEAMSDDSQQKKEAEKKLKEVQEEIKKLSEELGRWQDPAQSIISLEEARDGLLKIQLVDMGNGITLVQDNPEDLTLGAAYEGRASIMLPPAWNANGMPQAFVKPLMGDDTVGYRWDYIKAKPSNDPDLSSSTETNKSVTFSTSGETREEF